MAPLMRSEFCSALLPSSAFWGGAEGSVTVGRESGSVHKLGEDPVREGILARGPKMAALAQTKRARAGASDDTVSRSVIEYA
jgi:hypothetical protein